VLKLKIWYILLFVNDICARQVL